MKSIGIGSVALVMSMIPAIAGAEGAPQVVAKQVIRQVAAPTSNPIEEAAKAAATAAAAADRKPAEAGHVHAAPTAVQSQMTHKAVAPPSNSVVTTVTTMPTMPTTPGHVHSGHAHSDHVHVVQSHGGDRPLTYDYRDTERGDVTYQGRWTGTWSGHYEGQPTQVYNGTYDGRYGGSAQHRSDRKRRENHYHAGPGHYYGYGWGAPVMTTVTFHSAPIVTTTTTTTEEVIYAAAPRKRIARRSWKPRPKQRCAC